MFFKSLTRKVISTGLIVALSLPCLAMAKADPSLDNYFIDFEVGTDDIETGDFSLNYDATNEELVRGFVTRLYTVVLGREAEEGGLNFWTNALLSQQATGGSLASQFLNSSEFIARNLSNEEYIAILYRLFFDRDASIDPSGYSYWVRKLTETTRDKVTESFVDSNEWKSICANYGILPGAYTPYVAPAPTSTPTPTEIPAGEVGEEGAKNFVRRLYQYCLGRTADETGLNYWTYKLTSGQFTGVQLAQQFFYGDEYTAKRNTLTNDEIIERFYIVFFNRYSEETGANYWKGILAAEGGYDNCFKGFSNSVEFRDVCNRYGIESGVNIRVPSTDEAYERWVSGEQRGISRLNQATNLVPHRTYQSINVRSSTSTTKTVTISDKDWEICAQFAAEHFDPTWTAGEKVAYTMYWINRNVTYVTGSGWNAISGCGYAEAVFVKKAGQCAQYNGALTMMMCYLGYDVSEIVGYRCSNSGNTFSHYWNEVYINGQTYVNEAGNYGDSGSWHFLCCLYGSEATKFVKNGVRM